MLCLFFVVDLSLAYGAATMLSIPFATVVAAKLVVGGTLIIFKTCSQLSDGLNQAHE